MVNYPRAYRAYGTRDTPWERYAKVSGEHISHVFLQELDGRVEPLGRALDLGCGRGTYSSELARLGWDVTGIDTAPEAIAGARPVVMHRCTMSWGMQRSFRSRTWAPLIYLSTLAASKAWTANSV